jgi:hypothetical protein
MERNADGEKDTSDSTSLPTTEEQRLLDLQGADHGAQIRGTPQNFIGSFSDSRILVAHCTTIPAFSSSMFDVRAGACFKLLGCCINALDQRSENSWTQIVAAISSQLTVICRQKTLFPTQ